MSLSVIDTAESKLSGVDDIADSKPSCVADIARSQKPQKQYYKFYFHILIEKQILTVYCILLNTPYSLVKNICSAYIYIPTQI